MRIKVDRRSSAYKRISSAGFKIANINIEKCYLAGELRYTPIIRFKCICGKTEVAHSGFYSRTELPRKLDVARLIEDAGSVSAEHLQQDGYTQEQIAYIRRAY